MKFPYNIVSDMQQIGMQYQQGGNANEVLTDIVPYLFDALRILADSPDKQQFVEQVIKEYQRIVGEGE